MIDSEVKKMLLYSIRIPTTSFIFGTSIPTSMQFIPIAKGVRLTEVSITLRELQEYYHHGKRLEHARDVTKVDVPVNEEPRMLNERGEEGWSFQQTLQLPETMARMIQDVDQLGIRIGHMLEFTVKAVNADGKSKSV